MNRKSINAGRYNLGGMCSGGEKPKDIKDTWKRFLPTIECGITCYGQK